MLVRCKVLLTSLCGRCLVLIVHESALETSKAFAVREVTAHLVMGRVSPVIDYARTSAGARLRYMLLVGLLSGERDPTGRLRYGGDLETLVRLYGGDLGRRPGDLELHLQMHRITTYVYAHTTALPAAASSPPDW